MTTSDSSRAPATISASSARRRTRASRRRSAVPVAASSSTAPASARSVSSAGAPGARRSRCRRTSASRPFATPSRSVTRLGALRDGEERGFRARRRRLTSGKEGGRSSRRARRARSADPRLRAVEIRLVRIDPTSGAPAGRADACPALGRLADRVGGFGPDFGHGRSRAPGAMSAMSAGRSRRPSARIARSAVSGSRLRDPGAEGRQIGRVGARRSSAWRIASRADGTTAPGCACSSRRRAQSTERDDTETAEKRRTIRVLRGFVTPCWSVASAALRALSAKVPRGRRVLEHLRRQIQRIRDRDVGDLAGGVSSPASSFGMTKPV